MDRLSLDIERCMAGVGGERGLTPAMMEELRPRLKQSRKVMHPECRSGDAGVDGPTSSGSICAAGLRGGGRGRYDSLLVVGIGGSALGTTALATALLPFYYNELSSAERGLRPRLYVLDNVDPDETVAVLGRLDLSRTLVNVISKSGTTGESMAGYLVVQRASGGRYGPRRR